MTKLKNIVIKDPMLFVSVLAMVISLFITPPKIELINDIDWKTLATLFMLLLILDGFKKENLFNPIIKLTSNMKTMLGISLFLVFGVFFTSMFVTNDVSLIIFVPLTIIIFRYGNKEKYIIPIISLENIAAVRGSLLTPFGSPQNLFLFSKSGISNKDFLLMMLPLTIMSIVLLILFLVVMYRKDLKEEIVISKNEVNEWDKNRKDKRLTYLILFFIVITTIVTRTTYWPYVLLFVTLTLIFVDKDVFKRVDYALILTFFCFFIFSSSLANNEVIASFLRKTVSGNEYIASILISQVISNVPASIVLWPFTLDLKPLIYGLDTAGLVTVIGSLASVINMRIYVKEYPGHGLDFIKGFEIVSLLFFIIVFPLQLLLL